MYNTMNYRNKKNITVVTIKKSALINIYLKVL